VSRELYSERAGQGRALDAGDFMKLIWGVIRAMRADGFFDAALGERTMLGSYAHGRLKESDFIRRLNVSGIYQLAHDPGGISPGWVNDDVPLLFDVIEFLYADATPEDKRDGFRERLNPDLALYTPPMEMLWNGQIVEQAPDELRPLLEDPIPSDIPKPLADPLQHAIEQYRRRGATEHDKRSALKHLADVLEPLRKDIDESILPADEQALFHIANKFHIRHNDREQQRSYDPDIWLDWIFYVYVATARALLAALDREELRERVLGEPPDDNGGIPF
jgi:hypothetical protein